MNEAAVKENTQLYASDGTALIADYYPAEGKKGMMLLHMMPADRSSWVSFAKKAQARGYKTLALDLRGHGESENGPNGYVQFSDEEHQKSILDVEAGDLFLREKGTVEITVMGASIGANLALERLAQNPQMKSAVLLSAGLDYRGILTKPFVKKMVPEQAIYFVASRDDENAADAASILFQLCASGKKQIKIFEQGGHGTTMLEAHPECMEEILQWLDEIMTK